MNHNDELDAIIDRHAAPPPPEPDPRKFRKPLPPQFEPFTPAATMGGWCNTDKPEIARLPWGDVILDGDEVSALIDDGAWCDEVTVKLPSSSIARLVATQLLTIGATGDRAWEQVLQLLKDYEPPF